MEGKGFPRGPGLCVHTAIAHTNTHHTQAKKRSSANTDPCERLGFMELMGGCMGTLPGGSFCLFFWWRRRRRRPSSSHHEDRRARKRAECISAVRFLREITAEVIAPYCKRCKKKPCKNWLCGKRKDGNRSKFGDKIEKAMTWLTKWCMKYFLPNANTLTNQGVLSVNHIKHLNIL